VRRGELLGHHGETEAALSDFDRAEALDPALTAVALARGELLFGAGRFAEAKAALDRFLAAQPNHAAALSTRARTHAELGRPADAVADYAGAVRARIELGQAWPDDYLERARVLAAWGGEHTLEALRGIEEGIGQLGPIVSLELYAIDLELLAGRQEAALTRVAALLAQSPRKERWLARRAEILEGAGRDAEARLAYEQATRAISALPARHRRTRATRELENRVEEGLARLRTDETKETSP
jgi:tetratricopeptide (TPR) repeat protein